MIPVFCQLKFERMITIYRNFYFDIKNLKTDATTVISHDNK